MTRRASLDALPWADARGVVYTVDLTGGVGGRGFFAPATVVRETVYGGVVHTVDAARAGGFRGRFVLLTTMGAARPSWWLRLLAQAKPGALAASRDKVAYLRASGLAYTVVAAGTLHDGPPDRAPLRLARGELPMGLTTRLSRRTLAEVLVDALTEPAAAGAVFSVYGGGGAKLPRGAFRHLLAASPDGSPPNG